MLEATGIGFDWDVQEAGEATIATEGTPLPERVIESIRAQRRGPQGTDHDARRLRLPLRQRRPAAGARAVRQRPPGAHMQGVETRYKDVDLIIVRENTEDLYAGIEHRVGPDAAESIKIITRAASQRIARYAFEYAVAQRPAQGHRRAQGEHHEAVRRPLPRVAAGRSPPSTRAGSSSRTGSSTTCACSWSRSPSCTTCSCCPNLYGDIVCDLAAGLVGGLGVARARTSARRRRSSRRSTARRPKYAGQNRANPTALILSAALMLRHLGETDGGRRGRSGRARGDRRGRDGHRTTSAAGPAPASSPAVASPRAIERAPCSAAARAAWEVTRRRSLFGYRDQWAQLAWFGHRRQRVGRAPLPLHAHRRDVDRALRAGRLQHRRRTSSRTCRRGSARSCSWRRSSTTPSTGCG